MKTFFILIFLTALTAIFTKPADEKCHAKAAGAIQQKLKEELPARVGILNRLVDFKVNRAISVEDRIVFKSIHYARKGKSKMVGWGALGYIYVSVE